MDEIKNVPPDVFSKFLDPIVHVNPFRDNRSGERVYRRAERIVSAIYLLTNHISESELLRSEARRLGIQTLQKILEMRDEMRLIGSPKMLDLQKSFRELISMLKLMVFGSFVSTQNAEVLIAAIDELNSSLIGSARSVLADPIRFTKDDFSNVAYEHKGHIRDIKDRVNIKDIIAIKDKSGVSFITNSPSGESTLSQRGREIVDILSSRGELNIRDIAAHLPEYGEKTIQRELGQLIEQKVIRRVGLKRWSRYVLQGPEVNKEQ